MKYGEYRQQCRNIIGQLNRKSDSLYKVYRYHDDNPWSNTHFRNNKIVFKEGRQVLAMYKTWKEMSEYLFKYIKSIENMAFSIEWYKDGNWHRRDIIT